MGLHNLSSSLTLSSSSSSLPLQFHSNFNNTLIPQTPTRKFLTIRMAQNSPTQNDTKFVTFLGKGGSGKTFSAVFAAQVVGEELGVLPGMDTIFSALELEKFVGFLNNKNQKNNPKYNFDIIVYDGLSTEETIRLIGATGKSRLYLKYMRMLAEKTDMGRLAGPSLLRLVDESLNAGVSSSGLNGKLTGEIWDKLDHMLENGSSFITKPELFGCYLVMDLSDPMSINSALRYWGCAVQAGALVSGAFGVTRSGYGQDHLETAKKTFSPLPFASHPSVSFSDPLKWENIMHNGQCNDAQDLLNAAKSGSSEYMQPVTFNSVNKTVTLLMPGFDKSEIKLYQYRGGSELLIEAGDQRRVVFLPSQIQGKVGGAKFIDRKLIITMR